MIKNIIICLILVIFPISAFAYKDACKPVNKKKIICKYRAGKWKNGKCIYKKIRRKRRKRRYFRVKRRACNCKRSIRVIKIVNSCKPSVVVIANNPVKKESVKVVPTVLITPVTPKVKIIKKSDFFSWDVGAGGFALGLFNTGEKQFLTGFYGTSVIRLWDRISFSGFLGGSVWQDANLYIASIVGARVYKQLTLTAGFHAFFGDFTGSRIGRRLLLGSIGIEYLFKKRLNVSLESLFGLKSFVPPLCYDQENNFMLGIMLKVSIFFTI